MRFDRTQKDVDTALLYLKKLQNGEKITTSGFSFILRGTLNVIDLNRIEKKQKELQGLVNAKGYWNTPIENKDKDWEYTDIFYVDDFQRILDNTNILRQAFFVYKDTPNTPPISYHYEDINALEKILYDLGEMVKDVEDHYRQCGDFKCGEE